MPSVAGSTPRESSTARDAALAELVESYLARLQAGEAIDPNDFVAEHPEHAERLARLLPALELMDDLRRSSIHPGSGLSLTPVLMEAPGVTPGLVGDFQIVREVGRGGMGVVYEARQISLDRRVALKVLPLAAAMDPRQLQRFQLEAKAAACLHHTNIVPVHAVGCERGVHYYAMQFIEGQTLAAIIGELRALEASREGEPPGEPPLKMARTEPRPPGIAEGDLASRLANGELAPAEPSPSPRAGEGGPKGRMRGGSGDAGVGRNPPDPAPPSATGTPPSGPLSSTPTRSRAFFRTVADLGIQAAEAIEHAHGLGVVHRDIKPANILIDHRGTLWITDFGLARLRNDSGLTMTGDLMGTLRYMSPEQAMGRAVDIDHRTDIYSLAVTLYELMTRRPAITGRDRQEVLREVAHEEPTPPRRLEPVIPRELETIVLKAMAKEVAGRYQTAQDLADDLRRFLEHKPIQARRPSLVEQTAKWISRHRMVVTTAFSFLVLAVVTLAISTVLIARQRREAEKRRDEARQAVDDMYTGVAEEWLAQKAALEPVQRAFLQKALDYYQRFAGEQSADPKVRLKTAMAYRRVGEIQQKLGYSSEAETAHRRALAIIEELAPSSPPAPQYQSELATSHGSLGRLLFQTGHHAAAEPLLRRAIALLEKLAADSPSEPRYQSQRAGLHNHLGYLLSRSGRPGEAEQQYHQAIALNEKLVADFPASPRYQGDLADSQINLGLLLSEMGRRVEAEPAYRRTIALLEKLATDSPSVPQYRLSLARSHANLGVLLRETDHRGQAEHEYRRAIVLLEKLVADSPSVPHYRNFLALAHSNLSALLEDAERWADAESAARRATELYSKLVADSPAVPDYQSNLAAVYLNLGKVLDNTHHDAEAEHAYRQAIALEEKLASESPSVPRYRSLLGWSHKNLGLLLSHSGRPGEAEREYHKAIALNEKLVADFPDIYEHKNQLASSSIDLADLLEAAGHRTEAEPLYRRVIALREKMADAASQNDLAWILATNPNPRLQDPQRALRAAQKAVEQSDQAGRYWGTLGLAHYRLGDWKATIEALEKSIQLDAGGGAGDWFFLAMACWQKGEKDRARQWYERAVQWMERNKSRDEDLRRFRAEAAAVLGFTGHPKESNKKEGTPTPPSKP
jgi:serine/threonine protein kinase/Flp pilus assembly protein TadD